MVWRNSDTWAFSYGVLTLQNGVSVTFPHLQRAAARQFCGINRYRQPHFYWSLTNLESSVWLHRCCRSHERRWYQEGLNFFTCKEKLGNAGSKTEMVRVGMRFEGCEFNDELLIHPELSAMLENPNTLQLHHYHMIRVCTSKAIWAGSIRNVGCQLLTQLMPSAQI